VILPLVLILVAVLSLFAVLLVSWAAAFHYRRTRRRRGMAERPGARHKAQGTGSARCIAAHAAVPLLSLAQGMPQRHHGGRRAG
jgi:hypothetical protein